MLATVALTVIGASDAPAFGVATVRRSVSPCSEEEDDAEAPVTATDLCTGEALT